MRDGRSPAHGGGSTPAAANHRRLLRRYHGERAKARSMRRTAMRKGDAIEPNQLRALVQEAIERHLPPEQFEILKAAEESEREIIARLVGKIARKRLR